jgi:hypothetical protein
MVSYVRYVQTFLSHVWNIVGRNSEQIKIFSGIFVSAFVLWEYYDRQQDDKIARALSYVTEHQAQRRMDALVESKLVWLKNPDYMNALSGTEAITNGRDPASEQLQGSHPKLSKLDVIRKLIERHETFEYHLQGLQNFYHSVAQCTLSGVCDAQTICQTFFGDVQTFRRMYIEYFDQWSEHWLENKGTIIDQLIEFCDNPNYHYAYIKP